MRLIDGSGKYLSGVSQYLVAPAAIEWSTLTSSALGGDMPINQMPYRWGSLESVRLSGTTYQVCCYWDQNLQLVIGVRTLGEEWTFYTYDGSGGLPDIAVAGDDNHDVCVVGLDPNGYVHTAYGMHAEALNYRRSDAPVSSWTGALTAELSMLGTNESAVTYPMFVNDPSGALYFFFRDGTSGDGDLYGYKYDHAAGTWAGLAGTTAGKIIDGQSSSENAYWARPVFDDDFGSGGRLHLLWSWRETGDETTNHDVCYAGWDGTNWTQADGDAQTMPITTANDEVAVSINTGSGLCSLVGVPAASDSHGWPQVIYTMLGVDEYMHKYLCRWTGEAWATSQVTTSEADYFSDHSMADRDIGEAVHVIDRTTDTVHLIFRDDAGTPGLLHWQSSDYATWTEDVISADAYHAYGIGFDPRAWESGLRLMLMLPAWQAGQASLPIYLIDHVTGT